MEEIDKPFRPHLDFVIVWVLLTIPGVRYAFRWIQDPWYSVVAFALVVPFIATFFLYGPVLLVRQILRSGARGRFVARVFLSIVVALAALIAILLYHGTVACDRGHQFCGRDFGRSHVLFELENWKRTTSNTTLFGEPRRFTSRVNRTFRKVVTPRLNFSRFGLGNHHHWHAVTNPCGGLFVCYIFATVHGVAFACDVQKRPIILGGGGEYFDASEVRPFRITALQAKDRIIIPRLPPRRRSHGTPSERCLPRKGHKQA